MEILDAYIGGEDGKPILSKAVCVGDQKVYEATQLIFATGNKAYKRSVLSKEVQELETSGNIQICAGKNEYAVLDWENGEMYRSVNLQRFEKTNFYFPKSTPRIFVYIGGVYLMAYHDRMLHYSVNAQDWDECDLDETIGGKDVSYQLVGVVSRDASGKDRLLIFKEMSTSQNVTRIVYGHLYGSVSDLADVNIMLKTIGSMRVFASYDQYKNNDVLSDAIFVQCGDRCIMKGTASYGMSMYDPKNFSYDYAVAEIPYMELLRNGAVFDGQYIYGTLSGKVVRTTMDGETGAIEVPFEDESDNNRYIGGISHDGENICVYVYETSDPRKHDLYHVADGKLRYIETMLQGVTGFSEGTLYCRKF